MTQTGIFSLPTRGRTKSFDDCRTGPFMSSGTGTAGYSGDGGPAVNAELDWPNGIAVAPNGTIYIADAFNNRVEPSHQRE